MTHKYTIILIIWTWVVTTLLKFTKAHGEQKTFCYSLSFCNIHVVYYSWKLTCSDIGKSSSFPYFSLLNVKNHWETPNTIYLTLMICLIKFSKSSQFHWTWLKGTFIRIIYDYDVLKYPFESPFGHHPSRSIWVLQVLKFESHIMPTTKTII
jgi:hypothetical protein